MIKPEETIASKDIILRPLRMSDEEAMFAIFSDHMAMKYWSTTAHHSLSETSKIIKKKYFPSDKDVADTTWSITLANSAQNCIGWISFFSFRKGICEVGYALNREFWGQGIMYNALTLALKDAFTRFSLHRLEAQMHPDNIASKNLLLKIGFSVEGYQRLNFLRDGEFEDTLLLAKLRYDKLVSSGHQSLNN